MNETKQATGTGEAVEAYTVAVQCVIANLRQRPNLKSKVVRQAKRGDVLAAVGDDGEWTALEGGLYIMTALVERC